MRPFASMPPNLTQDVLGVHWDEERHPIASAEQTAFSWDKQTRVQNDQIALRALFACMVRKAGGVDWLTAALNKEPSYASKITDAINGVKDRKIQVEWMAPLLDDVGAMDVFLRWLSERTNHKPPVRERVVSREQVAEATRRVVVELSETAKVGIRNAVAKELGVRPEDVGL